MVFKTDLCPHSPDACVKVTIGTQPDCISTTVPITALTTGAVAKIPVTLAQLTVQVNMDSVITLPELALEIKNINKSIKVTQCLLLLDPVNDTNGNGNGNSPTLLSIKGYIRKNIDYSTRLCSNKEGVCGDIRHCTVDVPFSCMTPVTFNGALPVLPQVNTTAEFEFFRRQKLHGPGFAEKDHLLSGDLSEYNQVSQEFFTELPFCELISARIVEYDEYLNRKHSCDTYLPFEEREFRQIEEKMVLFITLKVLQNQQVVIPPPIPIEPCGVAAQSGGFEVKVTPHNMGSTPGTVRLCYNMLNQPDKIEITHNGNIVATTGGFVSGTGSLEFFYNATGDKFVVVTATGSEAGTLWCYFIGCPNDTLCDPDNPPCSPFSTSSSSSVITMGDWKTDSEWLAANGGKTNDEGKCL